jgi:hypothetical protein
MSSKQFAFDPKLDFAIERFKASGFYQGTEIAIDQLVAHVMTMK